MRSPRQSYLETQNEEMKSLREYEVARDKLLVYGLNDEEVAKVKDEVGSQKARMTFRSPARRNRDLPRRRARQRLRRR